MFGDCKRLPVQLSAEMRLNGAFAWRCCLSTNTSWIVLFDNCVFAHFANRTDKMCYTKVVRTVRVLSQLHESSASVLRKLPFFVMFAFNMLYIRMQRLFMLCCVGCYCWWHCELCCCRKNVTRFGELVVCVCAAFPSSQIAALVQPTTLMLALPQAKLRTNIY